jgi:hypothetical protein
MIGNSRGKWGDVQILGGGTLSGNTFAQQGQEEKKDLEQQLIEKRGFGEAEPPVFFIG